MLCRLNEEEKEELRKEESWEKIKIAVTKKTSENGTARMKNECWNYECLDEPKTRMKTRAKTERKSF